MEYIVGQIFGGIAVLVGFLTYQTKTQERLLLLQMLTCGIFCIHYLLIGATVGAMLNLIALVRNVAYFYRNKMLKGAHWIPVSFMILCGAAGIFAWEAWYSIFSTVGIVINSGCMSFSNPQNVRKSILVTSPMVLVYNIFAKSIGGSIYESVAIVSAIVGIWRYRKKNA